jgi:hypothetical protein
MIVALAAALIVSCEDTTPLAPVESDFTATASPETIVIDEPGGQTEGQAVITAQIFESSNYPLEGISVTFTTTGGTLSDPDNPEATAPITKETDEDGLAVVLLTLTLDDADTVTVTARSGTLTATANVTKSVGSGNLLPEAILVLDPPNSQERNKNILFDGRDSDDPDGDITCYKWAIDSTLQGSEREVAQGSSKEWFVKRYSDEQILSVELFVSDDPDCTALCVECGPPNDNNPCDVSDEAPSSCFSASAIEPNYEIVCDLTAPVVVVPSDQILTMEDTGTDGIPDAADIELSGSGSSDPEADSLTFTWNCGNGTGDQEVETVTCVYTSPSVDLDPPYYTARLTVTNVPCGMTSTDTVKITVQLP